MASLQTISLFLPPRYLVPAPLLDSRQVHRLKLQHRKSPTPLASNDASESETTDSQDADVDIAGVKVAPSMLKFYKREISPILRKSCRYVPTCNEYSMEGYKKYSIVKGGRVFDPPRWFDEEVIVDEWKAFAVDEESILLQSCKDHSPSEK